jgi:hypothetical protein
VKPTGQFKYFVSVVGIQMFVGRGGTVVVFITKYAVSLAVPDSPLQVTVCEELALTRGMTKDPLVPSPCPPLSQNCAPEEVQDMVTEAFIGKNTGEAVTSTQTKSPPPPPPPIFTKTLAVSAAEPPGPTHETV